MADVEARPVVIPLPDGDELWNAVQVGLVLGVSVATVWAYSNKGQPKNNPLPEYEADPVALIVLDPDVAQAVRQLLGVDARVARGASGPTPPRLWRASRIRAWVSSRPGRGNWRSADPNLGDAGADS